MATICVLNFVVCKFCGFCGILLSTKIYTARKLMPSILDDCTYHATMAMKINTTRIFLQTKNTKKILPMKFNTRLVSMLSLHYNYTVWLEIIAVVLMKWPPNYVLKYDGFYLMK